MKMVVCLSHHEGIAEDGEFLISKEQRVLITGRDIEREDVNYKAT